MRGKLWFSGLILILAILIPKLHAVQPKVVYGNDDRLDYYQVSNPQIRHSANATVALLRAASLSDQGATTSIQSVPYGAGMGLCADEPFYSQETAAFCSGFLVTPDTVVTAGHCIRTQDNCAETRFVFGFKISTQNAFPHSVPTDHVFACKSVVHSVVTPQDEDFAVVKLDRAVPFVQPLAVRTSGTPTVGGELHVIGYPLGLPVKVAGGAHVRAVKSQFLVANLDTYGGNSGSAVFNTQSGEVEGVLVRGEMDFITKNGCRTTNRCAEDGCRGEDVTLIERVLPYLK